MRVPPQNERALATWEDEGGTMGVALRDAGERELARCLPALPAGYERRFRTHRTPVATRAGHPRCAACHSEDDVRWQDALGDLGFCYDCLDRARTTLPYSELGGES